MTLTRQMLYITILPACAQFAVEQGILDHIKAFNDEQTLPSLNDPGKIFSLSATKCFSLKDFYTTFARTRESIFVQF